MNVFEKIKNIVEKETGLVCVYEQENISDNQVMVRISEIEKTETAGKYQIYGTFFIKTGTITGWTVLTQILDLHLTGIRAGASISQSENGFAIMSIEFSLICEQEEKRIYKVKSLQYNNEEEQCLSM